MDKIEELLTRGVANIIPEKVALKKLLESGKKLNIYLGIDPTATKIHLGHAVPLRKLAKFSELGHNVTFLIGDFTALIGDTSDKESERPVLTSEEIEENFKTYKKQAEKILDFSKIKVRNNSEWLSNLSFKEVVKLAQEFSFGDFAGRELIKKRLIASKHVGLHEGFYPAIQGYDSYMLDTDIQIGGTDQTFNMQAGRVLQKNRRNKESYVLATEFLQGSDGRKMSKTWNNAIWLDDDPNDMYRKIMAINDDLIIQYFTLATDLPMSAIKNIEEELKKTNPLNSKKELARQIVKELHGEKESEDAGNNFTKTPSDIRIFKVAGTETIIDILIKTELAASKSEAKRLVEQRGVSLDGRIINNLDENIEIRNEMTLKVGKHKFVKIKPS
ncbi:MAG: tyrosine--tRNA ligase [Patescibacteria group bacterium]